MLSDLNHIGLEWLLIFIISDGGDDRADGKDRVCSELLSWHRIPVHSLEQVDQDWNVHAEVLLEILLDYVSDGADELKCHSLQGLVVFGDASLKNGLEGRKDIARVLEHDILAANFSLFLIVLIHGHEALAEGKD